MTAMLTIPSRKNLDYASTRYTSALSIQRISKVHSLSTRKRDKLVFIVFITAARNINSETLSPKSGVIVTNRIVLQEGDVFASKHCRYTPIE